MLISKGANEDVIDHKAKKYHDYEKHEEEEEGSHPAVESAVEKEEPREAETVNVQPEETENQPSVADHEEDGEKKEVEREGDGEVQVQIFFSKTDGIITYGCPGQGKKAPSQKG